MQFHVLLRDAMQELNMNAVTLANLMEKSESSISRWVNGVSAPGRFTLSQLGKLLKDDGDYFLQPGITYANGRSRH